MTTATDDLAEITRRLQALEDKEAIRQLIYYKARATDRADPIAEERAFGASTPYADRRGPAALCHRAVSVNCSSDLMRPWSTAIRCAKAASSAAPPCLPRPR